MFDERLEENGKPLARRTEKQNSTKTPLLSAGWVKWRMTECRDCGSFDGAYKENARGDAEYKCGACGYSWWVDGPDS